VLAAVFAWCDAAFAFEGFREVAQVAETGVDGYVVNAVIGVFQFSAGGVQALLKDIFAGADSDYSHEHALKMRYRHAIFGSFLCFLNSPAALAADEIWVQKKRVVSDAPEAWFGGCCFMDFSLVFY
jgi:hypothetical protein